jgi:polyphenol oxidase
MSYVSVDALKYYSFDLLQDLPIHQAVFTRRGGVSPSPWGSLNVGGTNGDERERVVENRRRMFAAFGRRVDSLFDVWQVHGDVAIASDRPRPLDAPHQEADIILTDQSEVTLFMRFGDCVPIFLVDPVRKAICIAHAGWQGTVQKVAAAAVKAMHDHYGSLPENIHAGIGPSVGVHHYEVGENVIEAAEKTFGQDAPELLPYLNGKKHFDLWKANEITLRQAGVQHIQISGVCTVCHIDDWFSHRGEYGKTGRFGALLALKNGSKRD